MPSISVPLDDFNQIDVSVVNHIEKEQNHCKCEDFYDVNNYFFQYQYTIKCAFHKQNIKKSKANLLENNLKKNTLILLALFPDSTPLAARCWASVAIISGPEPAAVSGPVSICAWPSIAPLNAARSRLPTLARNRLPILVRGRLPARTHPILIN